MANPKLPTNGTNELIERYANAILKLKRKQNVVRGLFGRDYEGDPKAGAVKIPTRNTEVTVASYDVVSGVSLTTSATTYTTVTVTQDDAVNELIDGYEAAAVPDNIVAQRIDSGAYSLGRKQELYAIAELQENGTLNTTIGTAKTTAANVYAGIVDDVKTLLALGIAVADIKVVISPETWASLLTDEKFTNTASQIGSERVQQGVINMIAGADVYLSANLYDAEADAAGQTGKDVTTEWIVFSPLWAQTIEDWKVMPAINDLRDGAHIGASALQGRIVYEDALLDATTCLVQIWAVTS